MPPTSEPEQRRQLVAEERAWERENGRPAGGELDGEVKYHLLGRRIDVAQGSLGLQSLLCATLFKGHAEAAADAIETYRRTGDVSEEEGTKKFFILLALETYAVALTPDEATMFAACMMIEIPAPGSIYLSAGEAVGVPAVAKALHRLRGPGLLDTYRAGGREVEPAYLPNRLALPCFAEPDEDGQKKVATAITHPPLRRSPR